MFCVEPILETTNSPFSQLTSFIERTCLQFYVLLCSSSQFSCGSFMLIADRDRVWVRDRESLCNKSNMWPHCNQRKSELSLSRHMQFAIAIVLPLPDNGTCFDCALPQAQAQAQEKSIRKAGKTRATSSIRICRNRRNKKIRHEKRNRLNCVQNACTQCVAS